MCGGVERQTKRTSTIESKVSATVADFVKRVYAASAVQRELRYTLSVATPHRSIKDLDRLRIVSRRLIPIATIRSAICCDGDPRTLASKGIASDVNVEWTSLFLQ